MTGTKPFRFGVIDEQPGSAAEWFAAARRTEALGYATLLLRDHFIPEPFGDQFAPFPALMAAALATTTLRVGTLVCDNDYRHPVMLAKEAATRAGSAPNTRQRGWTSTRTACALRASRRRCRSSRVSSPIHR